jgi:tol-pal system protein YbgF
MKSATLKSALLLLACCSSLQARAALFEDDDARRTIIEQRGRIDALTKRVDDKADKSSVLELARENEKLRGEVTQLRGQIEVLTNELSNEQRRNRSLYGDIDARMKKLEPQRMTVDGKEVDVGPNEKAQYESALALFKANDFRGAASAFSTFLANNPGSGYSASSYYWLGSSHYALRDYKSSITANQMVVSRYPDNPRAPDALLNIATAYTELKDKANARNTLDTLITQYPNSQAAATGKERMTKLR